MKTQKKLIKVHIESEADLKPLKWGESYTIKMKDGHMFEKMGYNQMQNKAWFLNNVDYYLIEEDQPVQNEQSKDKNLYIERIKNLQAIIRHCDSPSIGNPRFDMVLELTKKDKNIADAIDKQTGQPTEENKAVEEHETCDGCQMFCDNGCMLDVSVCPDCWERDQWTPKENKARTAEEILKKEILESLKPQFATDEIRLLGLSNFMHSPSWKHILKAMEEYRNQGVPTITDEEINRYANKNYPVSKGIKYDHTYDENEQFRQICIKSIRWAINKLKQ